MHVLVTGGSGFIGGHLIDALLADDHDVTSIDPVPWPDAPGRQRPAIVITAKADVGTEFLVNQPDVIVHLGAIVGPRDVVERTYEMTTDGASDIMALVHLARTCDARLLVASSSEVYGWNDDRWDEEAPTLLPPTSMPRTGYAVTKLFTECLTLAAHREYSVRATVTRFFNVVGTRQRPGFVLTNFVRAALRGEPLVLHGLGAARRTFTHVRDAVAAIRALIPCEEAVGQVVNIGGDWLTEQPPTMRDVAEYVVNHCTERYQRTAPITYATYEGTGDMAWMRMRSRRPRIERLAGLVGHRPTADWREAVRDVCAYEARRMGLA